MSSDVKETFLWAFILTILQKSALLYCNGTVLEAKLASLLQYRENNRVLQPGPHFCCSNPVIMSISCGKVKLTNLNNCWDIRKVATTGLIVN